MQRSKSKARNDTTNKRKEHRREAKRKHAKVVMAIFIAEAQLFYGHVGSDLRDMIIYGNSGLMACSFEDLLKLVDKYYYQLRDPEQKYPVTDGGFRHLNADETINTLLHHSAKVMDSIADALLLG